MASDQAVWEALNDIQSTLKKWEREQRRLPEEITNDANKQLLIEMEEANSSLQTTIDDALSSEIRAEASVANLSKQIRGVAHLFVMLDKIEFAKEILKAEHSLTIKEPSERRAKEEDRLMGISEEQVEVLAALVDLGKEDEARELARELSRRASAKKEELEPQEVEAAAEPIEDMEPEEFVAEADEEMIPEVGSRRAIQEERVAGTHKRAHGISRLIDIVEGDIMKRRFNHQVKRWTDETFTPEKAAALQRELVAACGKIIRKRMA